MVSLVKQFDTNVNIKVMDPQGNIVREINDCNAETLWAKIASPVTGTLYLDFVDEPFENFFGLPISKINKTCFEQTDIIRSNLLSSSFTKTDQTYSVDFNYGDRCGCFCAIFCPK